MPVEIALVDAFTRVAGAGNRAGVVLDARALDDAAMQRIARKVGASETAFVFPRENGTGIRFFTPEKEIMFCGHATLATMWRLLELGHITPPSTFAVVTRAGTVPIVLEPEAERARVWIEVPIADFRPPPLDVDLVIDLMRGRSEMIDRSLPVIACGGQMFLPLEQRRDLFALAPRWDALAEAGSAHALRGFYVYTREVVEPGSLAHGRYFAPAVGVREDPVTGSASGPLVAFFVRQGLVPVPCRAVLEQGDAIGKPGRVEVEVSPAGVPGQADRIRIGGFAATVLTGEIDYESD